MLLVWGRRQHTVLLVHSRHTMLLVWATQATFSIIGMGDAGNLQCYCYWGHTMLLVWGTQATYNVIGMGDTVNIQCWWESNVTCNLHIYLATCLSWKVSKFPKSRLCGRFMSHQNSSSGVVVDIGKSFLSKSRSCNIQANIAAG